MFSILARCLRRKCFSFGLSVLISASTPDILVKTNHQSRQNHIFHHELARNQLHETDHPHHNNFPKIGGNRVAITTIRNFRNLIITKRQSIPSIELSCHYPDHMSLLVKAVFFKSQISRHSLRFYSLFWRTRLD